MQHLTYEFWFDTQAEEAAKFYTAIFPNSSIGPITKYPKEGFEITGKPEGEVLTVDFQLNGVSFQALNAGPKFKLNPSISFFANCETEEETNQLWEKLAADGTVLMPLDKYDWSPRFGWLEDKYGVSWQIILASSDQKITASLLFTGKNFGRAREAINFYTSIFSNSAIIQVIPDEKEPVQYSLFSLLGQHLTAMDSGIAHNFNFNEALSIVVNCDTQEEVDYFWNKLISDGGEESECGWLKDKFGVSWQVTPIKLSAMMLDPDQNKTARLMKALLQMKKLDLPELERAFTSA
jgi:predicted 3-demethylubiquinone-9 3-methyltransferase (glyoxalase superfamily)